MLKKKLPSIADQGEPQDMDGEAQESHRRSMNRESSKTSIDRQNRQKRDAEISAWVERQEAVRSAHNARPSIREYYSEPVTSKSPRSPAHSFASFAPSSNGRPEVSVKK